MANSDFSIVAIINCEYNRMEVKISKFTRTILLNHYEWCKKEGRNTNWYKKYEK